MSQYDNLFNSTRIPELEKDMIYQDVTAKHVVVMRNGHFYTFDVLDETDGIISPKEIASRLKHILEDNAVAAQNPIGVLTTTERDLWAVTRHHLSEIGNHDLLKTIDSAIMVLVLDEESVADDYKKLLRTFLHGNGTNRWFDKSFSLIVAKDGTSGINFEHSWGDGVAVLRYLQVRIQNSQLRARATTRLNNYFFPGHQERHIGEAEATPRRRVFGVSKFFCKKARCCNRRENRIRDKSSQEKVYEMVLGARS